MSALDKAEIERVGDAEQVVDRARAETKPLARDVLQRFMLLFDSLAGHYQPGSPSNPNVNASFFGTKTVWSWNLTESMLVTKNCWL